MAESVAVMCRGWWLNQRSLEDGLVLQLLSFSTVFFSSCRNSIQVFFRCSENAPIKKNASLYSFFFHLRSVSPQTEYNSVWLLFCNTVTPDAIAGIQDSTSNVLLLFFYFYKLRFFLLFSFFVVFVYTASFFFLPSFVSSAVSNSFSLFF